MRINIPLQWAVERLESRSMRQLYLKNRIEFDSWTNISDLYQQFHWKNTQTITNIATFLSKVTSLEARAAPLLWFFC